MPPPNEHQQKLASALSGEKRCLLRLKQSLAHEREALETRDINTLQQAVTGKKNLLDEIAKLQEKRAALLQQYGFSNDETGLSRYIGQCSPPLSRELQILWKQLFTLTGQCRAQNAMNGQIIELSERCIRQALTVLASGAQPVELYSADGISSRPGSPTSLAKA